MTQRKWTTILFAVAMMFFFAANLVDNSVAGESVAEPIPVAESGCSGSSQSVLMVARWTPVRNIFTRCKLRRAARKSCSGAPSGCSAPQAAPSCSGSVQSIQVITVAPIRLFRSCASGQCR
jgi:hypothetical protein